MKTVQETLIIDRILRTEKIVKTTIILTTMDKQKINKIDGHYWRWLEYL